MKFDWSIVATMGVAVSMGIAGGLAMHLRGPELIVFMALLTLVGVAAAAAIAYFKSRPKAQAALASATGMGAGPAAPAPAAGGDGEIDTLVRESDQRLAHANAGATIANLPLIFVIGDRSTAKTSTVVNSGIEPELLAGQLYQDNLIAPTRTANLWFARGTALVEAGGPILGDPAKWMSLVKRLRPGKLKSLKGGAQSPRAVLLCASLEAFTQQGSADAITSAARYLQGRLSEVAQTLGIRFPVYILFTKTDRVPFFTEFVSTFNNEEASQVFGVTVPMRAVHETGVYAEDETRRLTGYFDNLFYSLCDKRTVFPPRDTEQEKICGAYEFPREIRKARELMVRFMVDVCRPSQLMTSPFLRGFYFSGVRPVVVSDAAPIIASRPQQADYQGEGVSGATGMFRVGKQAEMKAAQSVAQPVAASRRVPQWMFLGHLFNNIILNDTAAMSASGSSVKVSALRRGLLIAASVLCLGLAIIFLVSYLGNRTLETKALTAAEKIDAKDVPAGKLPVLGSLQQLDTLRGELEQLDKYELNGAPYRIRWGLYRGSDMYPEVQRLYFARFKALLFGQTQTGLLTYMQGVKAPASETADYGYPYNTLKAYLLTTSEYKRESDKSLQEFLGNLLLARWSENRETDIGKDRMDLAKRQFDYYARVLAMENPFSDKGNADAIAGSRAYLASFKGPKRIYYGMLADAAKQARSQSFNQWAEGSAETVASAYPVAFAYTQKGSAYMLDKINNAKFVGEPWVLGPEISNADNPAQMKTDVMALYVQDYIKQWRTVLKTSHLVPYKDLKDAATKLDTLTGGTAPILAVIAWTGQNTAIDGMPDVKNAFRAAAALEPPGSPSYITPPVQPYNDSLQALQSVIAKLDPANLDPSVLKPAMDAADAARSVTKKIGSALPRDPGGGMDLVIGSLMMEPITDAERKFRPSPEPFNASGAGFCKSFGPITRKFPFNPVARDEVTLAELGDIFKPAGSKFAALEDGLKTLIVCKAGTCSVVEKPPVTANPAFVVFMNQLAKMSYALYGDAGTDPNYKYTLTPQKNPDQIDAFEITINGDASKLTGGSGKPFVWPGAGSPSFKLDLDLAGGSPLGQQDRTGLWSVFRFFADADRTTANGSSYDFTFAPRVGRGDSPQTVKGKPLLYTFTVDANIFSKDFLASMKCPPSVAK